LHSPPFAALALRVHLAKRLNGLSLTLALCWSQVNVVGDVRFGSEADMCAAKCQVRFTPESDHKSRHAASSDPAGDEQTAKRH